MVGPACNATHDNWLPKNRCVTQSERNNFSEKGERGRSPFLGTSVEPLSLSLSLSLSLFQSVGTMANSPAAEANSGEMTALQKHAAFFDRNKDGVIYPWETFQGFRAIGAGIGLSVAGAAFINGFLGPKTRTGKIPSPLLPIYIKNIQRGKHGSDTGAYDAQGRFVPAKFEDIFKNHAHTHPNALTSSELMEMLQAYSVRTDYQGRLAAWTEWKALYLLCKDKDGLLPKETVRAVYDGSLFFQMEKERA